MQATVLPNDIQEAFRAQVSSVQKCLDALNYTGSVVTLLDGTTLHRHSDGLYVYTPYKGEGIPQVYGANLTSYDLESLFTVILLRGATLTPLVVDTTLTPSVVIEADLVVECKHE